MAEIMQEKGLSLGTVISWLFTLLFSFMTPYIVHKGGEEAVGILFISCGGITIVCALFVCTLMKETKGKSLNERKSLYSKD